jgi:hypothetical protein
MSTTLGENLDARKIRNVLHEYEISDVREIFTYLFLKKSLLVYTVIQITGNTPPPTYSLIH